MRVPGRRIGWVSSSAAVLMFGCLGADEGVVPDAQVEVTGGSAASGGGQGGDSIVHDATAPLPDAPRAGDQSPAPGDVLPADARIATDAAPPVDAGAPADALSAPDVPRSDAVPADAVATPDQALSPPDAGIGDADDDGIPDDVDLCVNQPDPRQGDVDGDGLGDACDRGDADLDGLPDTMDLCPGTPLPSADGDGDGVGDLCDVCPENPDRLQVDSDSDGIGDACEIPNDDDADGAPDWSDVCPLRFDPHQADADEDGVGDACDLCLYAPDPDQLDADLDGLGDACDPCADEAMGGPGDLDADADGVLVCAGDCDDARPDRAPTLPERCNGFDDNCDGRIDEGYFGLGDACATDLGACRRVGTFACTPDGLADCDAVPAAPTPETCNGIDDDCDAAIDEGLRGCCPLGSREACGTEIGICTRGERTCDAEGMWGECSGVMPEPETCDGIDQDCDGQIDDALGDRVCGLGVCAHPMPLCRQGADNLCDPFAGAHPEVCNGVDDDCDGETDEGVLNACGRCGALPVEVCNGVDDDCDGAIDEGVLNACGGCGAVPAEACNGADDDCDGVVDDGVQNACGGCGAPSVEACNFRDDDCDGQIDENVRNACGGCGPVAPEVCNGADDDCDGQVDEGVLNACGRCGAAPVERCNGQDDDCDGTVDEGDFGDCLTQEPGHCAAGRAVCGEGLLRCVRLSEPRAEVCNGLDDDCDGTIDDLPPAQLRTYNRDADADGFGDPAVTTEACQAPPGFVANATDCYDRNRSAFPGQVGYFDSHRGDGSYDYNCDRREDRRWTSVMAYACELLACVYRDGWDRAVPPCGATDDWLAGCNGAANVCFSFAFVARRQACR